MSKNINWRIIMEERKKYRNCFVIFIDMLGTQNKNDIDSIYLDYSIFHSTILDKDGKYITDGRDGNIISDEKFVCMHIAFLIVRICYTCMIMIL